MPSIELLLAFFAASAVFAYIPGPAMIYAAGQTMARGRASGLMASLGIHVGGYVHVAAAAMGLTVLFDAVPVLYTVVKLTGAGYLVWLGLAMILGGSRPPTVVSAALPRSRRRAFFESVTVEVLNPKTAIFFVAFLPQFVDAAATLPVWAQFLLLGTIVNVMFSSADLLCVLLAGTVIRRLRHSGSGQRVMQRLGGSLLVGLGAHLALQRSQ
jgi:threonine/homoserine/homoserine lactone efflux protein